MFLSTWGLIHDIQSMIKSRAIKQGNGTEGRTENTKSTRLPAGRHYYCGHLATHRPERRLCWQGS